MKKGQMFTWDMILGAAIFLLAFANIVQLWQTSYDELRYAETQYEMNWLAETVSDQLVRTPGDPYNWRTDNINAFGLAEVTGSGKIVESRVLDADKILNMITLFQKNYSIARNKFLGSSRYDVYLELSCLNSTYLKCLQGIPLHEITTTIRCQNQDIHINAYNADYRFTDVYLWFEAEDLWGQYADTVCQKGCSGGNMSNIGNLPAGPHPVSVKTVPGEYWIWARTEEAESTTKLLVDGVPYPLFNKSFPGLVGWAYVGNKTLKRTTTLDFLGIQGGDYVDALLMTTDRFYDPRGQNPASYGNPNVQEPCIIGNKKEGADSISVSKTAVIGLPLTMNNIFTGMQPIIDDTFQVNVVVWGGEAMPPRNTSGGTTTTTIRPTNELNCTGSPSEGCIAKNLPVIDIENVTIWGGLGPTDTIVCGGDTPLTVIWRGRHAGDPNYFGFFIENSSYFIGACESNNTPNEAGTQLYNYDMNCTLESAYMDPTNIKLPDGGYNLVVTGEDFKGYCYPYPTNLSADSEEKIPIQLQSCVTYVPFSCTSTYGLRKGGCVGTNTNTVQKVHRVDAGTVSCFASNPVDVYWSGSHGTDDDQVQWAFILKDGGDKYCVGTCKSNVVDTGTNYYKMTCDLQANATTECDGTTAHTLGNGEQQLYVVAETDKSLVYCWNPDDLSAEAVGYATVTVEDC